LQSCNSGILLMDFYLLLGIRREASATDIKRAYRRLARRLHPDINPGDGVAAAQFQKVAEAYETLIDPERRRTYDLRGAAPQAPAEELSVAFHGFDFSMSVSGPSAPTFGDLFGDILQRRAAERAQEVERGADLHQSITLRFDEAFRGGRRDLTITRRERCRTCEGTGRLAAAERNCLHCQGAGVVRSARGHMVFSKPCARCGGTGRQTDTTCVSCNGQQTVPHTETVTVDIPPGVADGARLRIAGKGHAGRNGGSAGDLVVLVQVEAHPLYRRDGDDLHIVLPLGIDEAALGTKVEVQAPDGWARVRILPGTQTGQRFRLRERGMPSARDGRRGDLIVEVRLVLPPVLDERSKELLREFGRINDAAGIRRRLQDLDSTVVIGPR
jgi:molecular chaperone DnaJ